jgi:hypothetical protein
LVSNITLERTTQSTVSRYKLNLPFSERRLLLFLGDIAMIIAATGAAFWLNALIA